MKYSIIYVLIVKLDFLNPPVMTKFALNKLFVIIMIHIMTLLQTHAYLVLLLMIKFKIQLTQVNA